MSTYKTVLILLGPPPAAAGMSTYKTVLVLLMGLSSPARAWWQQPAQGAAEPALAQQCAALALAHAISLMRQSAPASLLEDMGLDFMPALTFAIMLANRFINGPSSLPETATLDEHRCCCHLNAGAGAGAGAGAAPVLSFRRARSCLQLLDVTGSAPRVGGLIVGILTHLRFMTAQVPTAYEDEIVQGNASMGGLALELQHLALAVLQARQLRAAGRRGGAGGGSGVPSCADPAFFLGDVGAGALPAVLRGPVMFLSNNAGFLAVTLRAMGISGVRSRQPGCPRCTPQQLLLLLEAATLFPPEAAVRRDKAYNHVASACMFVAAHRAPERPWLPQFMDKAVPTLAAWVLAAAQQLPRTDVFVRTQAQAPALSLAASVLLMPQGALQSVEHGQVAALRRLLATQELALRSLSADRRNFAWPEALGTLKVIGWWLRALPAPRGFAVAAGGRRLQCMGWAAAALAPGGVVT
jgi:hypothetical protein